MPQRTIQSALKIDVRPLTPERWDDAVKLFGPRGACAGCWCMYPRLKRSQFSAGKGSGNRRRFRDLVKRGDEPGVIAYHGGRPVGWCSIAPREVFVQLANSRVLKPVDEKPVWSITCFFVARPFRRRGVSVQLLRGAVRFAGKRGAKIVEGYPVLPRAGKSMPDVFAWMGLPGAYLTAGFREVHRHSPARPIMRCVIR